MLLQELIAGYIDSKYGWSVAEQFESTFSNAQDFEKQNYNALMYIYGCATELLRSDFFDEDAHDELQSYRDDLSDYLTIERTSRITN
jgi:hypothetical protein